jgi:hypothetical protein
MDHSSFELLLNNGLLSRNPDLKTQWERMKRSNRKHAVDGKGQQGYVEAPHDAHATLEMLKRDILVYLANKASQIFPYVMTIPISARSHLK